MRIRRPHSIDLRETTLTDIDRRFQRRVEFEGWELSWQGDGRCRQPYARFRGLPGAINANLLKGLDHVFGAQEPIARILP